MSTTDAAAAPGAPPGAGAEPPVLAFVQLGDLHLADERQRNHLDLLLIASQLETQCGEALDFVLLPGDNADNGEPSQYALAATALRMLRRPVHAIPGDHDVEGGGLDAFRHGLAPLPLPRAVTARGVRCLLLDASGPGQGGPDFRLGASQLDWLSRELRDADAHAQRAIVAMHVYPADLRGEGEAAALLALLHRHDVALVAMGHTHYNEVANDGHTVFAATRSTGQVEEGPPGYSVITLDAGALGWRFKPLDDPFPLVVITSPADHRLARDAAPRAAGQTAVRALVLGHEAMASVRCRVGDGPWTAMAPDGARRIWSARVELPEAALHRITVRALDADGRPAEHAIEAAGTLHTPPARHRDGSDADRIDAWPANGIPGTQLGPNRNGRHW